MESEDVSEEVKWEAQRVAAAFCVESFEQEHLPEILECRSQLERMVTRWHVDLRDGTLHLAHIYQFEPEMGSVTQECCVLMTDYRDVFQDSPVIVSLAESDLDHLMARGLYRLGFEDESILSQLPSLTAHEKLELRLSMPREFWPETWLEEMADGT